MSEGQLAVAQRARHPRPDQLFTVVGEGATKMGSGVRQLAMFLAFGLVSVGPFAQQSSRTSDVLVGTFVSESRANFGTEPAGAVRISVSPPVSGRYPTTMEVNGKQLWKTELVRCDAATEPYLQNRVPGAGAGLCRIEEGGRPSFAAIFLFSENGFRLPAVKEKYINNPALIKQDGLAPGDPRLMEERHHKAQYFAHVQWSFYAFGRLAP